MAADLSPIGFITDPCYDLAQTIREKLIAHRGGGRVFTVFVRSGLIYATGGSSRVIESVPPRNLVGVYNAKVRELDLADDIRSFQEETC